MEDLGRIIMDVAWSVERAALDVERLDPPLAAKLQAAAVRLSEGIGEIADQGAYFIAICAQELALRDRDLARRLIAYSNRLRGALGRRPADLAPATVEESVHDEPASPSGSPHRNRRRRRSPDHPAVD